MTIKERIHLEFDTKLGEEIKEFAKVFGIKYTSKAIRELIRIGLVAVRNRDKVQTQEQILQLEEEMREGRIVDYIQELDDRQFSVLWDIMLNEHNNVRGLSK
jgi:hypothetical protein